MKKRILITYFKNGDIQNEIAKKMMYETVVSELLLDGNDMVSESKGSNITSTTFSDGSVVDIVPCGTSLIGRRYTQVYTDSDTISQGYDVVLQPLLSREDYELGKQLNVYSFEDGKINIEKY